MTPATFRIAAAVLTALPVVLAACGSQSPAPAEAPPAPEATVIAPAESGSTSAPSATSAPAPAAAPRRPAPAAAAAPPARAPIAGASTPAPAAVAPAPPPANIEVTIPRGTELSIELLTDLSSETATVETPVRGRLRQAVMIGERTALPAGATLAGVVTDVERPGRVKGKALLSLRFTHVTVGGERTAISTDPITVEGEGDTKGDATKIGVGAGVGAVVGGILGGGSGAAKGAAIGGGAGTGVVLATRGKDVALASGTTLATELSAAKIVELPR